MPSMTQYLDCGCAIYDNGRRALCPTCANPATAKIPTIQMDVTKLGQISDETFVRAAAVVSHAADLYDLVVAHHKILTRCRAARSLTIAERSFLNASRTVLAKIESESPRGDR